MTHLRPFDRALLAGNPVDAARALVGGLLVREAGATASDGGRAAEQARRIGRIVEVEAYVGTEDEASHARFGRTTRNAVMWDEPGMAYVYLVYGMYDCLNVVVGPRGTPAAVLVRAVEPIEGLDAMRAARLAHAAARRRARSADDLRGEAARLAGLDPRRLASGPGALAAAFSIDRTATGRDLCAAHTPLRLVAGDPPPPETLVATPRIGIAYAGEPWRSMPWRFVDPRSRAVSARR